MQPDEIDLRKGNARAVPVSNGVSLATDTSNGRGAAEGAPDIRGAARMAGEGMKRYGGWASRTAYGALVCREIVVYNGRFRARNGWLRGVVH